MLVRKLSGENIAKRLSENLGKRVAMSEKNKGYVLNKNFEYQVTEEIQDFDYIIKSDRKINIEGINLPSYAIYVKLDSNSKIDKVAYYNYSALQSNFKGKKIDKVIQNGIIVEYGLNNKTLTN